MLRIVWNEFWYKNQSFWKFSLRPPWGTPWGVKNFEKIIFSKFWLISLPSSNLKRFGQTERELYHFEVITFIYSTNIYDLPANPRAAFGHLWKIPKVPPVIEKILKNSFIRENIHKNFPKNFEAIWLRSFQDRWGGAESAPPRGFATRK